MKTLRNKILMMAVVSMGLVACSKEEVKPFNAGGNVASGTDLSQKTTSVDDANDATTTTDDSGNNTATVDDQSTDSNSGDSSGITDGGTSSDYDSKGTKRKPGKN
jgi:hypothetical protein